MILLSLAERAAQTPRPALLTLALALCAPACGLSSANAVSNAGVDVPATRAPTVRGQKETFEIATWNLEQFPKAGDATVERIIDIVETLRLDVIAVQELADTNAFHDMVAHIPGWKSISAGRYDVSQSFSRYNPPVGFMYDSRSVKVRDRCLLFAGETTPFPRSPLALDIEWAGVPMTVIAVHLKALGDNVISSDPNDEEMRRKVACDMLAAYIDEHYIGRPVIVLGDYNDRLGEPPETDVYQAFTSRPDRFYFVDTEIAKHGGLNEVSYPPYASHIDHILITSELFPAFFNDRADVQTLTVEGFLENGWFEYEALVSDHRAVYTRLAPETPSGTLSKPLSPTTHPPSP